MSELRKNYFPEIDSIKQTFNEFINSETILKAEVKGKIIGFICYIRNGAFHSFPYIHLFTVMPEFRGKGYGSKLLEQFEMNQKDFSSKVFLVVADFNPEAKSFYIKNGYIQVGSIPSLYREGIDEALMMKEI